MISRSKIPPPRKWAINPHAPAERIYTSTVTDRYGNSATLTMTVSTAHIQRGLNAGNGQQARIEAERKAEAEAEEKARAKAEAERKRKEFAERLYRDVCERFGITGEKGKERLISSTP